MAPRFSLGNRHKRVFSGNYGYCSGVSWLVMGVGVSLGRETRSVRSGFMRTCVRVARIYCRTPSRYSLGRSGLYREFISFAANRVWAPGVGCRGCSRQNRVLGMFT